MMELISLLKNNLCLVTYLECYKEEWSNEDLILLN